MKTLLASSLQKLLRAEKDDMLAGVLQKFFKTGRGEYAYGDRFLGLTVPRIRKITQDFTELSFSEIVKLLQSPWHEERFAAALILSAQYKHADTASKKKIVNFYLQHAKRLNNWDLVDVSAEHVVGAHVFAARDMALLRRLARSNNLWERRIAVVATFFMIKRGECEATFEVCELLLSDSHDLIHKACGWMLRECGKKVSERQLEIFLRQHADRMPRTMLRYAIERFPESKRKKYLKMKKKITASQ